MKYKFIPQKGKIKIACTGELDIHNGEAIFWNDNKIVGVLKKPEVVFLNHLGIKLKGFESAGFNKKGIEKFNYIEWYCPFVEEGK